MIFIYSMNNQNKCSVHFLLEVSLHLLELGNIGMSLFGDGSLSLLLVGLELLLEGIELWLGSLELGLELLESNLVGSLVFLLGLLEVSDVDLEGWGELFLEESLGVISKSLELVLSLVELGTVNDVSLGGGGENGEEGEFHIF